MNLPTRHIRLLTRSQGLDVFKQFTLVNTRPGSNQVGIVRWRADTDRLGGTAICVAHVVRQRLEHVGSTGSELVPEDFVEKDRVVGGTSRTCGAISFPIRNMEYESEKLLTLKGRMGLEEKVPVAYIGNTAVDNGSLLRTFRPRMDMVAVGWIEARLMPFHRHYEGNARLRVLSIWVRLPTGLANIGQLLLEYHIELSFRDTIAEDDNVLRQSFVVMPPYSETLFEMVNELTIIGFPSDLLNPGFVLPGHSWPLGEATINTGHQANQTGRVIASTSGEVCGVSDVVTHKHRPLHQPSIVSDLVIYAAKFQVDLQANIGKVPRLPLLFHEHFLLNTHGGDAKLNITKLLDDVVGGGLLGGKEDKDKLWLRLVFGNGSESILQFFFARPSCLVAVRWCRLRVDGNAHFIVQELGEVQNGILDVSRINGRGRFSNY